MHKNLQLTQVASEYLRHHDELEGAREVYLSERNAQLERLGALMLDTAKFAGQSPSGILDKTNGSYDVYISGSYVRLRKREGDERKSGYSVAIGSYLDFVGAQTIIWFEVRLKPSRETTLEIRALREALGNSVQSFGHGKWLYLRTSAIPAIEVDLSLLEDEASRLPKLFAQADEWISARYKQ